MASSTVYTGIPRSVSRRSLISLTLMVVAVVGLVIDAYVHLKLASDYDANRTQQLSQGLLFRLEAALSIAAAVALIGWPRRYTALTVAGVAGSALLVLLVYRYFDIKALGPIPSMYEPIWFAEKAWSGIGELAALLAAGVLALVLPGRLLPARAHRASAAA
jgi:hypothetical protein